MVFHSSFLASGSLFFEPVGHRARTWRDDENRGRSGVERGACPSLRCDMAQALRTCDFANVFRLKAHDVLARVDLLRNEGLRRRHKNDLAGGIPAVKVVHDDSRNEGFPEACTGASGEVASVGRGGDW